MGSLGPNAKKEDYAKAAQNAVDQGLVPQQQENVFLQHLQAAPDSQTFYKQFMSSAMEGQKQIEMHTGINSQQSNGATNYQGKTNVVTGGFQPTTQVNQQLPPTTPNVNEQLTPGYLGPSGPSGVLPAQGGARLPVAAPNASAITPRPANAVSRSALPTTGPTGPTVQTGFNFKERFAGEPRVATGAAPGVAEAIKTVGEQSGKDYATALQSAGNIQTALQPDLAVLDIVKGKAPGDFGPGTDNLNQLKKVAVTWLPNVDPKIINDSSDYDTVKKYLIQGARSAGNTGTNDQLAAAFEANPNTTMNTATIENIVKSRVALKKMEAAQVLLANQQNIAPDQFSKWKAQNQNVLDPRAFGFDMMNDEAKQKLVTKLKKDPKAYQKFESSLQFAHDAELIGPPAGK
jgi:hypothetical protein